MIHFFRRRPTAARPIFAPLGADMHCHLLPCVDDGSRGNDETEVCLQVMHDAGFGKVYCTPHYQYPRFPNDEEDIKRRFADLKTDIAPNLQKLDIELAGVAGEYRYDSVFGERVEKDGFLLIAGKYLLVEFSLSQQVMGYEDVLFGLQMKGYEIILAHPERYPYFAGNSPRLEHLKEMGILFQANVLSLSGFYGEGPQIKAFDMVNRGWVDFLGTDLHNPIYARALIENTHDRKVEKLIETHTFLNNTL